MKRPIAALAMPDVKPGEPATSPPTFMMVRPTELLIDESYQRDLSDASFRLIRRIVEGWDWRKYKAPKVAMMPEGGVVLDGQHTAIGAASHPGIHEIPVLVVEAADQRDQASAFVGLNTNRIAVTVAQLHHANVAAGDGMALAVDRVCASAGIRVLRLPPARAVYKPGETIAVAALTGLVYRHGEEVAVQALKILAEAAFGPVQAAHIRAVEALTTNLEFADLDPPDLARIILAVGIDAAEKDAKVFASTHCVPLWRALASIWFKARKTKRKAPEQPSAFTSAEKSADVPVTSSPHGPATRYDQATAVAAARVAVPAPNFGTKGKPGRRG